MKTQLLGSDGNSLLRAASILADGGLVAIPTETVYGLAANALDEQAVSSIFKAKGRPQDNPLIVHVSCYEEIAPLVKEVDPRLPALAEKFWPGPLTVIMPKSDRVPYVTSGGLDTVAIRMPSHPVANEIIRLAGVPLAAPSANSSGKPSPTRASHVLQDMDGKIEAIVDGGECDIGVESTVITLATPVPTLLRPGGITPEQLEEVLGEIEISPAVFAALEEGQRVQSPGMKYKHYAPKAIVTIVDGTYDKYSFFMSLTENSAAVCFEGEGKDFSVSVEYGRKGDSLSQARGLFDALRLVDETGCGRAYVRCPERNGVGLAVYNRLLRAAAFRELNFSVRTPLIGLMGQTGAGKSTVCEELVKAGCVIADCDAISHEILTRKEVIAEICSAFGEDVAPDGVIDRKALGAKAFADEESRLKLNSIVHPAVTAEVRKIHALASEKGATAVIADAPVLTDSELYKDCALVVSVTAPGDVRLSRIMARDGISEERALQRMNAQKDEDFYKLHSDIIAVNGAGCSPADASEKILKALSLFGE